MNYGNFNRNMRRLDKSHSFRVSAVAPDGTSYFYAKFEFDDYLNLFKMVRGPMTVYFDDWNWTEDRRKLVLSRRYVGPDGIDRQITGVLEMLAPEEWSVGGWRLDR